MSRCSTPCRCAVSTALAMRTPIDSTSAIGSCTARYRWPRVAEQYSMTRYGRPSAATLAWYTVRMDGCDDSCAIRFASAWNIWRRSSFTTSASSTFTATRRRGMLLVEEHVSETAGTEDADEREAGKV